MEYMGQNTVSKFSEYLIDKVSTILGYSVDQIKESIEYSNGMNFLKNFLCIDGPNTIFFTEISANNNDQLRIISPSLSNDMMYQAPVISISDELDPSLRSRSLCFLRNNQTVFADIDGFIEGLFCFQLNLSENVLEASLSLLSRVIEPQLQCLSSKKSIDSPKTSSQSNSERDSYSDLGKFIKGITNSNQMLAREPEIMPCQPPELVSQLELFLTSQPSQITNEVRQNMKRLAETSITSWFDQLENILAREDQICREGTDTGLAVKRDYWRHRMIVFDKLRQQIQSKPFTTLLDFLNSPTCQSRLVKNWAPMRSRIITCANEAVVYVKLLYALEKYCEPMIGSTPSQVSRQLPKLMATMQLAKKAATTNNQGIDEQLGNLFVKITNQLIDVCKHFLTADCDQGQSDADINVIWRMDESLLLARLAECCQLNQAYQLAYRRHSWQSSTSSEANSPLSLSQVRIFGKFDAFCRRLTRIGRLVRIFKLFTSLSKVKLDETAELRLRFDHQVKIVKTKPYDYFDQRNSQFDVDYDEFISQLHTIQSDLNTAFLANFNPMPSVHRGLEIIHTYRKLGLGEDDLESNPLLDNNEDFQQNLGLCFQEAHYRVLRQYGHELISVGKEYNCDKESPPIDWSMPPIAGRIAWARQLYRRIEQPMLILKKLPELMQRKEAVDITRRYNKLAEVLLTFELMHFRDWVGKLEQVKTHLRVPVFAGILASNGLDFEVNLDPRVLQTYREIDLLVKMGFEMPPRAVELINQSTSIKRAYSQLKFLSSELTRVLVKINPLFLPLLRVQLVSLQTLLKPGLNNLVWSSLGIDKFVTRVTGQLSKLELLTNRLDDIKQFRIDQVLHSIARLQLFTLPDSANEASVWTMTEFVDQSRRLCLEAGQLIEVKSQTVQAAVGDLAAELCVEFDEKVNGQWIELIPTRDEVSLTDQLINGVESERASKYKRVEREQRAIMQDAIERMYGHFNNKFVHTLTNLIRSSLDRLRKHLTPDSINDSPLLVANNDSDGQAFLTCRAQLSLPGITMLPTGDEMHQLLTNLVRSIVGVGRFVGLWTKAPVSSLLGGIDDDGDGQSINSNSQRPSNRHGASATKITVNLRDSTSRQKPSLNAIDRSTRQVSNNNNSNDTVISSDERLSTTCSSNSTLTGPTPSMLDYGALDDDGAGVGPNYYRTVIENREVAKLRGLLVSMAKPLVKATSSLFDDEYRAYAQFWLNSKEDEMVKFASSSPSLTDYEAVLVGLKAKVDEVKSKPSVYHYGPLVVYMDDLKDAVVGEIESWQLVYMRLCMDQYRHLTDELASTIDRLEKLLSRPISDLDDIRIAMETIREVREMEPNIDRLIEPIEESYVMLAKYKLPIKQDDDYKVDTLQYAWYKLTRLANDTQATLVAIQPTFYSDLVKGIAQFQIDFAQFCRDYDSSGPTQPDLAPRDASDRLVIFQNQFDNLARLHTTYSAGERLFALPLSHYDRLEPLQKELQLLAKLYTLYNTVLNKTASYYRVSWRLLDVDSISAELQELQSRCLTLPKALRDYPAYQALKQSLSDFTDLMPLIELMTNSAMRPRHWNQLAKLLGRSELPVESDAFRLGTIFEAPVLANKAEVEDVCLGAIKEREIEIKLASVKADWTGRELQFSAFKSRGDLLLRGETTSELIESIEDSLMLAGSLATNRYNLPFKVDILHFVSRLSNTLEILDQWMSVQNLWVYLEAVFVGGPDIARQLPKEAKRFAGVDKSWTRLMQRAVDVKDVIECCVGEESMGQLLAHLMEQLELCQKSLTGYLEQKRLLFPRFFFVSDPKLLEILGQASDPHTIQPHLLTIFDNIKTVRFDEKQRELIRTCYSSEGEVLQLIEPVKAEGHVEVWLTGLLNESKRSLNEVIQQAHELVNSSDFDLLNFLQSFAAQVGILGIQFIWTRDATHALANCRIDRGLMRRTDQGFIKLLNALIVQTTHDLSRVERTKYETLITIHLHQKDIFSALVKEKIRSPLDFDWLKQTRFYYDDDDEKCRISITDVYFEYQNEFLGCTDRLVITPLTDRCYITLAQALGMSMGGSPAGPAGTGKTETVKDMGRTLGKYVVVTNCSDQMDFRGLGRIFKGLAQSGTWGCFDEFNRIELPVLSVAAQQIAIVLTARKEYKPNFLFSDGDLVEMNREFGIFITMNPGYAGRQELPENLKINFRNIAMMVPDRQIIIRVKLASAGFIENVVLAQKFFSLYKLCEEQLTKQIHYDFGLRNILSVLRTLGAAKCNSLTETEFSIVMRVLRDMNLSKLVGPDEPLFMSLLDDLFPGLSMTKGGYPDLEAIIKKHIQLEPDLVDHPPWLLKVVQLYETQRVRHGMMTLGPAGTGKTSCIRILMKTLTEYHEPHREMRMNPKAITAAQMFGRLDVATNDWTDGIFSTLWRRTLKVKKNEHVWLVLDGPVDALWIENLNSVLDDSKLLTLANGDRIPMSPNCKIVFEVDNIDNASPATVSRNGMVYISTSTLPWEPLLDGWLRTRPADEGKIIKGFFQSCFADVYRYAERHLVMKSRSLESFVIRQACDLLTGLISQVKPEKDCNTLPSAHLSKLFVFALLWSVGALLEGDDRAKLETFLRSNQSALDLPPTELSVGSAFDFCVDPLGHWQHWSTRVEDFAYPKDETPDFSRLIVPNVDNVRTDFLINLIASQHKAVLLIGEPGTAKTVILNNFLRRLNPEEHLHKVLNFSSVTTPQLFQRTIESFVDKRMGNTFGPPGGRRMTVFIDDISMPLINEWGDQITNELVRQLIEWHGFYNLSKPGDFTSILDMQFIGAMIHPGAGRNDIPQRLKRHFAQFNCTLPSATSIDKIFSTIALGHFVKERGFDVDDDGSSIRDLVERLVQLTRLVWQSTKGKMLPTPAKFHYIFNLRDLGRIWQGLITSQAEAVNTRSTLLALWRHECTRVLADRFTNQIDHDWFQSNLMSIAQSELGGEDSASLSASLPYFVNFLRDPPEPTGDEPENYIPEVPKVYEPIDSFDQLRDRLETFMTQYNERIRGANMNLVLFTDAMTQLVRIARLLYLSRGNALLVGVGGSGKQSLTRLASFIAGLTTHQITLTRSYNVANLMEDLKAMYRSAGTKGQGVTFLFTDQEIKDEAFLEPINNLLSSGVISGLFNREEIDEICQELIPVMKKELPRQPPTNENLLDFFYSRARKNLHIVLCFSPVGEKFHQRSLKFPGLFAGCTIIWFHRWPREALTSVADRYLSDFQLDCTSQVKSKLNHIMTSIHDGVADLCNKYFSRFRRQTHVTPTSYLAFVAGYKSVYRKQHDTFTQLAERMDGGLKKLVDAGESVVLLQQELATKEKELELANIEAEKVLQNVTRQQNASTEVRNKVQLVKDKAQSIVNTIDRERALTEEKLEAARPALEEAASALDTIKPSDIATVRRLGKPPNLIMRIMDCVLMLFQRRLSPNQCDPERKCFMPSWPEALKFMANTSFLSMLTNFPKDLINEETVELIEPYLAMDDYNIDTARRVCGNVAGLLSWTSAMVRFYAINKEVLPMKDNLVKLEAKLEQANDDLAKAQGRLDEKESELAKVQSLYDDALAKKQALLDDADTCRRKMSAASQLIESLGGEQTRWTEQSAAFKRRLSLLVGDVLIATAFISYCGPFNQEFRQSLNSTWLTAVKSDDIPMSSTLDLISMMTDSVQLGQWDVEGLPSDELSIQNAIIVDQASRYPLLIDPQGQGKAWLKQRERTSDLIVVTLNDRLFRQRLEEALGQGRPLLIEDVGEQLDPVLDNVLERNFIKQGTLLKVKLGDAEVDLVDGFKLYLTTKLANPSYTPEVYARASIIDFTVTIKGLEDQLLSRVIGHERSELERQRVELVQDVQLNQAKVKQLEDSLLQRLASVEGSLVDDVDLIDVLRSTKLTSAEVAKKLVTAHQTGKQIKEAREQYRPIASRGSVLYFLIVETSLINVMYQTSLVQFLTIFDKSLTDSEPSPVLSKRIEIILDHVTFGVWRYIMRGLYEQDKPTFSLLLALKIELRSQHITQDEFQYLIKGGASLDINTVNTPKPFKWIADATWLNLVTLSSLPQFSSLLDQVKMGEKVWLRWSEKPAPELAPLPKSLTRQLANADQYDSLERLLLIRAWFPDKLMTTAKAYIGRVLGPRFGESQVINLHEVLEDASKPQWPIVGLLSMGSDPTPGIEALAKFLKLDCRVISMGQGQEVHAHQLVSQAITNGGWVLLQNCHLSLVYLDELLVELTVKQIADSFRLWVTTEPHPKFPINFLQTSVKFTNEPPQGVKTSLKRTYTGFTQDFMETVTLPQWQPMIFAIAFLHTTVQERRQFGPLGWNIPYEFNASDLKASLQFAQNHLDDLGRGRSIDWKCIRFILGEIQYGGRVTDDWDKRLLNTYCKLWFNDTLFESDFRFSDRLPTPPFVKTPSPGQVINWLTELPLIDDSDSPELFGLHENASIACQRKRVRSILDCILAIQPKEAAAAVSVEGDGDQTKASGTREDVVREMALDLLNKLPPDYVAFEVAERLDQMGSLQPMIIFLRQELDRFQLVLSRVRITLIDLVNAVEGSIVLSDSLRQALDCMFDAKIPPEWVKISWESSTLGFWFTELIERNSQFSNWLKRGRPKCFWLTGFFNPQGFLTAVRQEVTRSHKGWALDSVTLWNEVTKMTHDEVKRPPSEGAYIHGLFIEGASFDRRLLQLAAPKPKLLYEPMPVIHIQALDIGKEGELPKQLTANTYRCPVYKKPMRTDLTFVTSMYLRYPAAFKNEYWILNGTALLCDVR